MEDITRKQAIELLENRHTLLASADWKSLELAKCLNYNDVYDLVKDNIDNGWWNKQDMTIRKLKSANTNSMKFTDGSKLDRGGVWSRNGNIIMRCDSEMVIVYLLQ